MPTRGDFGDGIQADFVSVHDQRLEDFGEHLQHLHVDDELLVGRTQPSLEPPGAMNENVATTEERSPQAHLRFINGLTVDDIRCGGVRGAPR
jgi:hypothetical protein